MTDRNQHFTRKHFLENLYGLVYIGVERALISQDEAKQICLSLPAPGTEPLPEPEVPPKKCEIFDLP